MSYFFKLLVKLKTETSVLIHVLDLHDKTNLKNIAHCSTSEFFLISSLVLLPIVVVSTEPWYSKNA